VNASPLKKTELVASMLKSHLITAGDTEVGTAIGSVHISGNSLVEMMFHMRQRYLPFSRSKPMGGFMAMHAHPTSWGGAITKAC
jgi:hypothetical protein